SGDGEIVEIAAVALRRAIGGDPIGALALAEEFAGAGIDSLANGFKLVRVDIAGQAEHGGAATPPGADDALAFGVIIAMLEVARRIALAVRHGADGQHGCPPLRRRRGSGMVSGLGSDVMLRGMGQRPMWLSGRF